MLFRLFALVCSHGLYEIPEYIVWLHILTIFKIRDVAKIGSKIEAYLNFNEKLQIFLQLAGLYLSILTVTHLMSCLWFLFGKISLSNGQPSWLDMLEQQKPQFNLDSLYEMYVQSFLWAMSMILGVGQGDMSPRNNLESVFSIITLLLGCGVFSYAITMISQIIIESERK